MNDFYSYSFLTRRWAVIPPKGPHPPPRYVPLSTHPPTHLFINLLTSPPTHPPTHLLSHSPRDRHVAAVHKHSFYVFGGFDGSQRVNDFFEYSFDANKGLGWRPVVSLTGKRRRAAPPTLSPPTPTHPPTHLLT